MADNVNEASGRQRNPDWTRDEIILALDLYMRHRQSLPSQTSAEVIELSKLLNDLAVLLEVETGPNYRNTNGVYMKLNNFRRLDPEYIALGKKGLKGGGAEEESVWADFYDKPAYLIELAASLRAAILSSKVSGAAAEPVSDDIDAEAMEGRVATVRHRRRERSRKIVEKKKASVLAAGGKLRCEACEFDFSTRYGERGKDFIEVHHIQPLHTLLEGKPTNLSDLALVCANCHRMIHAKRDWLTMDQLKDILRN